MKVGFARAMATEWVMQHASLEEGFRGAYFSGSTVGLSSDAELPASSDVDIMIVTTLNEPPPKLGKFTYKGVMLEVTYLSCNQLSSVDQVLTSYHLAGSFRINTIIADPSGDLYRLQSYISKHFAEKVWVYRRCENVRKKIESGLKNIDTSAPFYDQVTSWLFPTGITTHMLLVAALRNPTVRLRYLATRKMLVEYGYDEFYSELLELLGCTHMSPQRVEGHLHELARTFDAAVSVAKTPFFFSTDISTIARPIAIDGSRELIRSGYHHEAIFWIVATFARCHKILAVDTSADIQRSLMPAFEDVAADLGIRSAHDIIQRTEDVMRFIPKLWNMAENIISMNPDIIN